MHELSVTEGILKIVEEQAAVNGFKKVINIKIKSGVLSGVMPELIQEYFNIVSENTVAKGAELIVEKVPYKVMCLDCNVENEISIMKRRCPGCNSTNLKTISGKEFYIDSMEVE